MYFTSRKPAELIAEEFNGASKRLIKPKKIKYCAFRDSYHRKLGTKTFSLKGFPSVLQPNPIPTIYTSY